MVLSDSRVLPMCSFQNKSGMLQPQAQSTASGKKTLYPSRQVQNLNILYFIRGWGKDKLNFENVTEGHVEFHGRPVELGQPHTGIFRHLNYFIYFQCLLTTGSLFILGL